MINEHVVRIDEAEILDQTPNQDIPGQILDVVINMESNESGHMESIKNQNSPPPSYDEVINNGTDLTNPPPTYLESLRLNK